MVSVSSESSVDLQIPFALNQDKLIPDICQVPIESLKVKKKGLGIFNMLKDLSDEEKSQYYP